MSTHPAAVGMPVGRFPSRVPCCAPPSIRSAVGRHEAAGLRLQALSRGAGQLRGVLVRPWLLHDSGVQVQIQEPRAPQPLPAGHRRRLVLQLHRQTLHSVLRAAAVRAGDGAVSNHLQRCAKTGELGCGRCSTVSGADTRPAATDCNRPCPCCACHRLQCVSACSPSRMPRCGLCSAKKTCLACKKGWRKDARGKCTVRDGGDARKAAVKRRG